MPLVNLSHVTTYSYNQPVRFGEHRLMVRPRESYDQHLISAELTFHPEPKEVRWLQDVFGNAVAIATFEQRSDELEIRGTAEVEHLPAPWGAITVEPYAETYPFTYAAEDMPDLLRSIERQYADRDRLLDRWVGRFLADRVSIPTLGLLRDITNAIRQDFRYQRREEKGIQSPLETLRRGSGTCRDYAVLMMEAVRALGLAARFVSGYLYNEEGDHARIGGHSTHAWVRVFLPGSGWIEFDPTNGIIGNGGLIRVAVARDPAQASPLTGTWKGAKGSQIDMEVDVRIRHVDRTTHASHLAQQEIQPC